MFRYKIFKVFVIAIIGIYSACGDVDGVRTAAQLAVAPSLLPTALTNSPWPAFTIEVRDQFGAKTNPDAETNISVAIASGNGTLSGTKEQPVINGVATFDNLRSDVAGAITLNFTANSSENINIGSVTGVPVTVKGEFITIPTNSPGYQDLASNLVRDVFVDGRTIYAATNGGLALK